MCIYIIIIFTDVTVGFSMPSYIVQERDESVEVCVSLLGDTAIPIMINFSTVQETATGNYKIYFVLLYKLHEYFFSVQKPMITRRLQTTLCLLVTVLKKGA